MRIHKIRFPIFRIWQMIQTKCIRMQIKIRNDLVSNDSFESKQ